MTENILDRLAREVFGECKEIPDTEPARRSCEFDLKRPPGFVGEITDYINRQCRYPREHLAAMSAIVAVGNMGSMKYQSDTGGTSNLFAFCIAGSASGKESVLQAVIDLHIESGLSPACHGKIKSDKEIHMNLVRNQASMYIIDEVAVELEKIINSSRQGGAAYLQSVIGTLLSVYSKASGNYLVSGDMRADIIEDLRKYYAAESKKDDVDEKKLTEIIEKIDFIEKYGLKNPYLSMIGYTVPGTFNNMVSLAQIISGLLGRSLLANEPDNNPKRKRGFVKQTMAEELRERILYFCATGQTDSYRVEEAKQKVIVRTDDDAKAELEECADWFEDEADKHTERTGFEAVVRRGYEMVDKISFILAMESRKRTLEHVKWAFEYVARDIEYKTLLAYSNVKEKSDPVESMAAKIMCSLDDDGITAGRLINKYRAKKTVIEDAINFLEKKGKIRVESKKIKYRKEDTKIIYKA